MKQKQILKGTFGFLLVFGLVMAFASCELFMKTEITVLNDSLYDIVDNTVTVKVFIRGEDQYYLVAEEVPRGESVTFLLNEGEYQVKVIRLGGKEFLFPWEENITEYTYMSGEVLLKFDGKEVKRTN